METYAAAYDTWQSVRARLEHTIQDYFDACVMLREAFDVPPSSILSCERREQKLVELDSKLQSSQLHIARLQRAESYLGLARNTSHTLLPISLLPLKVLHMVLNLTTQLEKTNHSPRIMRTPTNSIITLSSVCSAWRMLMLHAPEFWTSPELVLSGDASKPCYELTTLWAERSRNSVLDLFISEGTQSSQPRTASPDWSTAAVEELMITLMPRVRALVIGVTSSFDHGALRPIMNCWAACGTLGRAERLDFWNTLQDGTGRVTMSTIRDRYTSISDTAFVDFYRSLHSLAVYGTWSGIPELVHAGLVELRIEGVIDRFPTLSDIAALLTATPRLRLLALVGFPVTENFDQPQLVPLNYLQVLILDDDESLWRVLGIITTSAKDIEASMSVDDDPECISTVHSFLTRTHILRLYMAASNIEIIGSISNALVRMPYLRELALEYLALPSRLLQKAVRESSSDIWPALRELQLIECEASPHALEHLVSIHPPETLYWAPDPTDDRIGTDAHADVEERLSKYGVNIIWATQGTDMPVHHWECGT